MKTIKTEKQEWVKTMKKLYPDFNPKLWSRSSKYREDHPQPVLN